VAVSSCPALEPPLDRALAAARGELGAALGEGGTVAGLVGAGDRVHLAVEPGEGADRAALEAGAGRGAAEGTAAGVAMGARAWGEATIDVGGGLRQSAAGFQQASRAQNETLRALVREAARPEGARVLELYAGDGNFTRDLAPAARELVAVE